MSRIFFSKITIISALFFLHYFSLFPSFSYQKPPMGAGRDSYLTKKIKKIKKQEVIHSPRYRSTILRLLRQKHLSSYNQIFDSLFGSCSTQTASSISSCKKNKLLQEENNELRYVIRDLEKQYTLLTLNFEETRHNYEEKIQGLKEKIKYTKKEVLPLQAENNQLKELIEKLELTLQKTNEENDNIKNSLEKKNAQEINEELASIQLPLVEEQLKKVGKELEKIKKDMETPKSDHLRALLQSEKATNDSLKTNLRNAQRKIEKTSDLIQMQLSIQGALYILIDHLTKGKTLEFEALLQKVLQTAALHDEKIEEDTDCFKKLEIREDSLRTLLTERASREVQAQIKFLQDLNRVYFSNLEAFLATKPDLWATAYFIAAQTALTQNCNL